MNLSLPARVLAAGVVGSFLLVSGMVAAGVQDGLGPAPSSVERETPRQTVVGFLESTRAGDFDVAAYYLDLSRIAAVDQQRSGSRLARRFKIVLDNTFWVDPHVVSENPSGASDDGLAADGDLLTTLQLGDGEIPVRLRLATLNDGTSAWLFDGATVAAIDELYSEHGFGWLGDRLPAFFFTVRFFEVELWQLLAIVLLLGLGWGLSQALTLPLMAALERGVANTEARWDDELATAVRGPLRMGLFAFVVFFGSQWLGLNAPVRQGLAVFWQLSAVLILGWLLSSWVSVGARLLERSVGDDGPSLARSFIPLFARVARIGVWALVAVLALDVAGVEVMGLIAGLGIGGLAIAFAAQKTIENFFGALAIASDRPFEAGDYVDIGGTTGTVEEVGLRSTRLRTTARTVVNIPNASIMTAKIENSSVRDRILFNPTIGLVYGSSRAQIELVIDEIKKLLAGHSMVYDESFRVRLSGFGDSSVNIGILSWIDTTSYHDYTAVVEELNLEMMRIVEEAGTDFAFPSQTIYLGKDGGLDVTRVAAIEDEVEARREAGDLWIPEPPEEA